MIQDTEEWCLEEAWFDHSPTCIIVRLDHLEYSGYDETELDREHSKTMD